MKYVSTRGQAPILNFEDVLLTGMAVDGGLYMPQIWPRLSTDHIHHFKGKSYTDVAYDVLHPFVGDTYEESQLRKMIEEAYHGFNHPDIVPLRHIKEQHYLLELFHGPTLAFKDIAMQLLARMMEDTLQRRNRRATIVVATSGDTGGAAVEAFRDCRSVNLFVLYPEGRVSDVQRKQMTTSKCHHIHSLAVSGTFDDCQSLVKDMFRDQAFRQDCQLTAVNSINWVRVMTQSVYYFTAAVALGSPQQSVSFSVPTGNFGDIFAGFVAHKMGLPITELRIATNVNDILVRALETGVYEIDDVIATATPSMDIQISSNFERLIFEASHRDDKKVVHLMQSLMRTGKFILDADMRAKMDSLFVAFSVDEEETKKTIHQLFIQSGLLVDPHTAVGFAAALRHIEGKIPMITLSTAHPAKFPLFVEKACGQKPPIPHVIENMMQKPEYSHAVAHDSAMIKDYIRSHI